jgi:3-oxoacyl-[acyl-carrier-protein] synthase-3
MYVPPRVVTNDELSLTLDTSDVWISTRTGIRERRVAGPDETTAGMAAQAGRAALAHAGLAATDVDLVLVATSTPEHVAFPSTSSLTQAALGAVGAGAMDVGAACTGFVYGLATADSFIRSGNARTVLLIGSETYSRILDWTDRSTCVLFGDGAGAVVLQASEGEHGVLACVLGADGCGGDMLIQPAGGAKLPPSHETLDQGMHYVKMDGRGVFKFSVNVVPEVARQVLAKVGLDTCDASLYILHQANSRIIQAVAKALQLPIEKFYMNLQRYGNTSSASIPIAIVEAVHEGALRDGDTVVFIGFGGGLTWGAAAVHWGAGKMGDDPLTTSLAEEGA